MRSYLTAQLFPSILSHVLVVARDLVNVTKQLLPVSLVHHGLRRLKSLFTSWDSATLHCTERKATIMLFVTVRDVTSVFAIFQSRSSQDAARVLLQPRANRENKNNPPVAGTGGQARKKFSFFDKIRNKNNSTNMNSLFKKKTK